MMIGVRKGPWERRCGMKRRNEEKSTAQEENRNTLHFSLSISVQSFTATLNSLFAGHIANTTPQNFEIRSAECMVSMVSI